MIKVGDYVTWRPLQQPNTLGLSNCQVIALIYENGVEYAKLDLGKFADHFPKPAIVPVQYLEKQEIEQ